MKMSSTSTTDSTKNVAMDQPMVTYSSVAATPKMTSSPAPSTIPQIPWGFPYNIWSNPHLFNQAFPGLGMMQTIPGPVAPSPPGFQPIASSPPITEPSTISKASTSTPADETTSSPLISEPSTSTISKASTSTPADETTSSPLISEPSTSIISKATTSSATITKPTTHGPIVDEETAVTRVSKSSSSSSSDELDEDEATFSVKKFNCAQTYVAKRCISAQTLSTVFEYPIIKARFVKTQWGDSYILHLLNQKNKEISIFLPRRYSCWLNKKNLDSFNRSKLKLKAKHRLVNRVIKGKELSVTVTDLTLIDCTT
ncbi:endochitinase A-like [Nilaparvata lugens]|uniref:endochitinase A-like n=1 Tax=Nilaparvata lugens TaxID=108931 RepID=UPI00193DABC1|nr:endochitinase A-like [Nilaparvata lugens]